jgi:hypothetical protein
MKMRFVACGLLWLPLLAGCAAQPTGPNPFQAMAESMNPPPAQSNYDRAVAGYKACLAAVGPSSPNACDGQRHIMEAAAQVAAAPNISQESNVYVGR